jgi:RNA-directed DNA polymerase
VSRLLSAMPNIRRRAPSSGDDFVRSSAFLPGETSRSPPLNADGSREERKDDMTKGREESDGRIAPQSRRKPVSTAAEQRGGKATTASQQAVQLGLFRETADSPQGADDGADADQSAPAPHAVPKSRTKKGNALPAMTMEEVASEENLRKAFQLVASNKGAPGPDKQSIDEVREHLAEVVLALRRELLNGSYRPGNIRRVWIPKSAGGQRGLGIPNVVDRIVAQAVHQVLSPHYEPTFHASSHGFRPGRSCHTAIAEAKQHLDDGYEWVVDLDLEKFFDRVHHQRLLARLEQKVSDRRLLSLIHQMLKAKVVMPDGVVMSVEEGVPQGGPLSPLLSNVVLDELDHELAQRGHRFVRYADDCNIYVRSERSGQRVMASIVRFIERRLRLKVNAEKSAVSRPEKRHFVGFSLRREPMDGNVEVRLSERSKSRIDEKIRELTPRTWGQSLRDCIRRVNEYFLGWVGFFHIISDTTTLAALDAHTRRRLRAIAIRHWDRKRRDGWRPLKPGRRSWWFLSNTSRVTRALSNARFAERGLVSLEVEWQRYQLLTVTAPVQLSLELG